MFRRAHISSLIALIAATLGFLGIIETSIAQTVFYLLMGFAALSVLLGMFEAERRPGVRKGHAALEPRRILDREPHRAAS